MDFGPDAPHCAPPDRDLRAPAVPLPAMSCDCHAHICGPESQFAYAAGRIYTPPDALLPDYAALLAKLGCSRAVLVQPSVYGTDNTVLIAALQSCRQHSVAGRGVAVVDYDVANEELERLDSAGVRGIRFNLVDVIKPGAELPLEPMRRLSMRVAERGWHVELLVHIDDYPTFDALFADWPADIVLGHMGYCRVGHNVGDNGFNALLQLVDAGRCWIKMTAPYRISSADWPYEDARAFAETLVARAPERLLWGTDWPHVMVTRTMPNDADLCDLFATWVSDARTRRMILVDNPSRLYGFG